MICSFYVKSKDKDLFRLGTNKNSKTMEKEILKRNIEQVINQPCLAHYPSEIIPNGLSADGKYICIKVYSDDSTWHCNLTEDFVDRILENLPEKYREHLVTIRHDENWASYSYIPVFDTDTQAMWDKEYKKFMDDKQAWCDRYGCE